MVKKCLKSTFLILVFSCMFVSNGSAQNTHERIQVALRMVGHQLLMHANDSSSRVLPIEVNNDQFRIRFESQFGFLPSQLAATIDSIVDTTNIARSYRVEVENNITKEIVYSYEVDTSKNIMVPCGPRRQEKASFDLLFTILDSGSMVSTKNNVALSEKPIRENTLWFISLFPVILLFIVLAVIGLYFWNRRRRVVQSSNQIRIGEYRFDQDRMRLTFKSTSIDLTGKETDLLVLLHSSVNKTLERDEILKVVWGDEGDYVGRTLDVFISKLRKKFSEDPNVRIVNVRGVGYKLMLGGA